MTKQNDKEITTLQDALNAGYRLGRTAWQQGYVSRKGTSNDQIAVHTNSKSGELYFLAPSWTSTRYCFRQYLYR